MHSRGWSLVRATGVVLLALLPFLAQALTVDRNITIGMTFSLTAPTALARVDQGKRTRDGTTSGTRAWWLRFFLGDSHFFLAARDPV
jgi:hypothetical protein